MIRRGCRIEGHTFTQKGKRHMPPDRTTPPPNNNSTPPLKPLTTIGIALVLLGLLLTGIGMLSSRVVLYVGWGLCLTGAALQVADRFGPG